jgi:hypothetical protein
VKIFYFNLKRTKNTKKGKLCQAGNERNQKKAVKDICEMTNQAYSGKSV